VVETKQPVSAIAVDSTPAKSSSSVSPLSREKLERKVKTMRGEYMQDPNNTEELLLTWEELSGTPDVGTQFDTVNANCFMAIEDSEHKAIVDIFTTLVEKGKLSSSAQFRASSNTILNSVSSPLALVDQDEIDLVRPLEAPLEIEGKVWF
jgi:hypothetical protein